MNESLALVIWGNAYLQGQNINGFWPDCPIFKFDKYAGFLDKTPKTLLGFSVFEAGNPLTWFKKLKRKGARGLRIYTQPQNLSEQGDHVLAGLVGGGRHWIIEVCYEQKSDLWEPQILLGDREDPERKIWASIHYRVAKNIKNDDNLKIDLEQTTELIDNALTDIIKFCKSTAPTTSGASYWLKYFEPAQQSLHGDLAPVFMDFPTLSLPAQRLMVSAITSSVFGAMGSWNDLGPMGDAEDAYNRVSAKLYSAINTAFTVAANSSFIQST